MFDLHARVSTFAAVADFLPHVCTDTWDSSVFALNVKIWTYFVSFRFLYLASSCESRQMRTFSSTQAAAATMCFCLVSMGILAHVGLTPSQAAIHQSDTASKILALNSKKNLGESTFLELHTTKILILLKSIFWQWALWLRWSKSGGQQQSWSSQPFQ